MRALETRFVTMLTSAALDWLGRKNSELMARCFGEIPGKRINIVVAAPSVNNLPEYSKSGLNPVEAVLMTSTFLRNRPSRYCPMRFGIPIASPYVGAGGPASLIIRLSRGAQ